jgi:hypothetical protein
MLYNGAVSGFRECGLPAALRRRQVSLTVYVIPCVRFNWFVRLSPPERGGQGLTGYDPITSWLRKSVTRSDAVGESEGLVSEVITNRLRPA